MKKFAEFIVKYKLVFVILFAVLAAGGAICLPFVQVNYDDTLYLPEDSETKLGLNAMYHEFGSSGNASLMLNNVDVEAATDFKQTLLAVDGVKSVVWIDELVEPFIEVPLQSMEEDGKEITRGKAVEFIVAIIGVLTPDFADLDLVDQVNVIMEAAPDEQPDKGLFTSFVLAMAPMMNDPSLNIGSATAFKDQIKTFYNENAAFYQIFFEEGDYSDSTYNAIRTIRSMENIEIYMSGSSATPYTARLTVTSETVTSMIVAGIVVIVILFLMTTSWWEPVLILLVIGASILINMGTNLALSSISYMTHGVSAVLQLALTMDYSIFLLNRYKQERRSGKDASPAMVDALRTSFSPIMASSMTTVAGFVALMFMQYKLGFDIGLVLTKGVIFSILAVFFFMPGMILLTEKLIFKGEHKTFNLRLGKFSNFLIKTRKFLPVLIILAIIPCIYFQGLNTYTYGPEASTGGPGSLLSEDKAVIEEKFGIQNQLAILLPVEYYDREAAITYDIIALGTDKVISVQSLSVIEEAGFDEMLPDSFLKQFKDKGNYTRVVVMLNCEQEGERPEAILAEIRAIVDRYVGDDIASGGKAYFMLGESESTLEIRDLVRSDYDIITYISIALVALIILISTRSILIPIILIGVIQGSIYINMVFPYLFDQPMIFVGYLLVSSILLGATIDYAILLSDRYVEHRATMNKFDAMRHAVSNSSRSLITSAGILTFAGFALGIVSGMPATSLFGMTIGRGGLCAFVLVLVLLPQLLILLDTPIRYTMWKGKERMIDNKKAEPAEETRRDTAK